MELIITEFFNHLGQNSWVDNFSVISSKIPVMAAIWTLACLSAILFDKRNGRWVLLAIIITLIIYFVINDFTFKYGLLKLMSVYRERPYLAHPETIRLIGYPFSDSSFPSGHMSSSAAISTVFIMVYGKKVVLPSIVFLLIMAFTRLHNGVHYPTDVLGGIILGVIYGYAGYYLVKYFRLRIKPIGLKANT